MLPDCLDSLRGCADEIVVVDTGSSDQTAAIARAAGAKVAYVEWRNSFAEARNASLELCSGTWVLVIDADERLQDGDGELRRLASDQGLDAIRLEIVNLTGRGGVGPRHATTQLRMFRRGHGVRWEGAIHEQLVGLAASARVVDADARLIHHGYREEVVRRKGKRLRNDRLLARQESGPYALYCRGNEQSFHGDPSAARATYERCLQGLVKREGPVGVPWGPLLLVRLARAQRMSGDPVAAAATAEHWLRVVPDHTDLAVERALAVADAGDLDAGLVALEGALAMGDGPARLGSTPGMCGAVGLTLRGQMLLSAGRPEEAIEAFRSALCRDPDHLAGLGALAAALLRTGTPAGAAVAELGPFVERNLVGAAGLLGTALLEAGAIAEAQAIFGRLHAADPGNPEARLGLAECALSRGDVAAAAAVCAADAPGAEEAAALARYALFCALVQPGGCHVPALLDRARTVGVDAADVEAFAAWHAPASARIGAPAARAAAHLLGAAVKLQAFESCDVLCGLVASSALEPEEAHCLVAEQFLTAGYADIAADMLIAAIEASGPSARALSGLARVALRRGLRGEAADLAQEAHRLDPTAPGPLRVLEALAQAA